MNRIVRSVTSAPLRRVGLIDQHLRASNARQIMTNNTTTVGIIIIGDEILKGHVTDTNSGYLCKRLFSMGVKVKKVSVIPDDLDTISQEVQKFSSSYTHVITSGGIGPTHDDVTFEAVAKAFDDVIEPHPDLVALCKKYFGTDDPKSPKLKLAHIPKTAELYYGTNKHTGQKHDYPFVVMRNIYILPGVPKFLERGFDMLEDRFRNPDRKFHVKEVYINKDELSVTSVLNQVDETFRDKIILGSYPDFYNSYYKVKLTMESEEKENLDSAYRFLESKLPPGSIVNYDKSPIGNAAEKVYELANCGENSILVRNLQNAIGIIEESLETYSLDEICVGFNGGKDCTALLHLVYACVKRKYPQNTPKLKALYIRRGVPFPEVELFIKYAKEKYNLDIITIEGRIKNAMEELKTRDPTIKATWMGTRSTDPFSDKLKSFSMTDPDWPQYMRVNPILNWTFGQVWGFMRRLSLPYCSLYDRGYTSLGSMENTHPNPALQFKDDKGIITYRPAYELENDESERAGRN